MQRMHEAQRLVFTIFLITFGSVNEVDSHNISRQSDFAL